MARRVSFYLDEHIAYAVAVGLRRRGVDAVTAAEAGLLGAPDEDILAWAKAEQRVIFTHDDDFLRLHSSGVSHAGIVFALQGMRIGEVIRGLKLVHDLLDVHDMAGHVEFL